MQEHVFAADFGSDGAVVFAMDRKPIQTCEYRVEESADGHKLQLIRGRPGESPQETALRSVREETGVEATVEEPIREKLGNICGQPRIWDSRKKGPGPWGAGTPDGEALSAGAHSLQNASLGLTGQLIPASNHFCQV